MGKKENVGEMSQGDCHWRNLPWVVGGHRSFLLGPRGLLELGVPDAALELSSMTLLLKKSSSPHPGGGARLPDGSQVLVPAGRKVPGYII